MNAISESHIQQISDLFAGYEYARGSYDVKSINERGKAEGKALTRKGAASDDDWRTHLAGTGPGLGIIPLRSDDTVSWGCIDIDVIGIDLAELERKCEEHGFPLVICRSKSGGAHAFLFLLEPVPAYDVVTKLQGWAATLGYGGCEIFPKQTSRYDETDVGNWLNMPYFYEKRTNRYGIRDGEPLSLDDFLAFARSRRVTPAQLDDLVAQVPDEPGGLFEDGPPCLQHLAAHGGFPHGMRNNGMFNVAVYLKRQDADDLEAKLNDYNMKLCDPPLAPSDVSDIAKSVTKKDYRYRCKKEPIHAHCNSQSCVKRAYGIDDNLPQIPHLTKFEGVPVLWLVEVDGKRIQLESRELMTQKLFQEKIGEAVNMYPKTLPQAEWESKLNGALANCTVQHVHEDDTSVGVFKAHLKSFLMGHARSKTPLDLYVSNAPHITETGDVWFKLTGLTKFLGHQNFRFKNEHQLTRMLRELGADTLTPWIDTPKGKKQTRVWVMRRDSSIGKEAFGEAEAEKAWAQEKKPKFEIEEF